MPLVMMLMMLLCWVLAAVMTTGGTDIHLGFAGVIAALGAVCLGLGGAINAIDELRKTMKP